MTGMIGRRFGRLTVERERRGAKNSGRVCLCKCSCGNKRWVRAVELRRTKYPTRSCGGYHPCSVCGELMPSRGETQHMAVHA